MAGKVVPFNLPDIGEGIAEVEILQWHVAEGQHISQFDKLLEVQSDKATVDITSRYDGTVRKLHYKVGDMAKTGKPLLDIELSAAGLPSQAAAAAAAPDVRPGASSSSSSSSSSSPAEEAGGSKASTAGSSSASSASARGIAAPAVRHLARQHDIPVASVPGTGKDGRVTKEDMLKAIAAREAGGAGVTAAAPTPAPAQAPGAGAGAGRAAGPASSALPQASGTASGAPLPRPVSWTGAVPADTRQPLRGLQRAMVKSMATAWEVPHFGYCDEIYMDALMALRAQLKPAADARRTKITFLPIMIKAASMALSEYPVLNSQLSPDGQEIVLRGAHNIGVAMDTPRGLIVPNVKNVQSLSIFAIAEQLAYLQARAAEGKLGEAELKDTTFR